jgi:hypothetical protein
MIGMEHEVMVNDGLGYFSQNGHRSLHAFFPLDSTLKDQQQHISLSLPVFFLEW